MHTLLSTSVRSSEIKGESRGLRRVNFQEVDSSLVKLSRVGFGNIMGQVDGSSLDND